MTLDTITRVKRIDLETILCVGLSLYLNNYTLIFKFVRNGTILKLKC